MLWNTQITTRKYWFNARLIFVEKPFNHEEIDDAKKAIVMEVYNTWYLSSEHSYKFRQLLVILSN